MEYRTRHAEKRLTELARHFKIVLVTGARQVGKSTLLSHVYPDIRSIVFDPTLDLYGERRDPDLFLDSFPSPLILDDIQYVPGLLPALKRRIDRSGRKGQYFLTGSQNLSMLRHVSESLAGRVGFLHLDCMTGQEMAGAGGDSTWLDRFLAGPDAFLGKASLLPQTVGPLVRYLWRGSLPGTLDLPDATVPDYMASYVRTYIERDVRTAADIRGLADFGRFLALSAALTGQEINDSQLGRELGLSPPTARRWRETLTQTYQWRELPAFHGNAVKRVSGRRKGHVSDTGLACWLQRLSSPTSLLGSPLMGRLFESMVVNLVHQQASAMAVPPAVWHWRASGGAEVDMVLERDGLLWPIEVKASTALSGHDTRGMRSFRETYGSRPIGTGLVIYAGSVIRKLDEHTYAVPWNFA